MKIEKGQICDYVLVCDVSVGDGSLIYYCGYFENIDHPTIKRIPKNSTEYAEAVKIPYKDEAEELCKKLNECQHSFKYHVEEHMYMFDPPEGWEEWSKNLKEKQLNNN